MDHKKYAGDLFLESYNCAQAVLGAFCDVTKMNFDDAMMLSSSLGGGMGRMREVCGACSSMFVIAGILRGYKDPKDDKAKAEHYAFIQQMAEEFKKKHKTIICRELMEGLKFDSSPIPTTRNEEFYKKRPCLKFVEDAAEIAEKMLLENK